MLIARHSFIQISKLSNVMGRIDYITNEKRQENLYAVYQRTPKTFWKELARCNQQEFRNSGTEGKCIEARELIIALPEQFVLHNAPFILRHFTKLFEDRYGVQCVSALHHNKAKTNYHIHLIFSERKLLEKPIEKVATRNMFYNEQGKRVRTKKEILGADNQVRKKCRIIPKGEIYERKLFTKKEEQFKAKSFLDEIKHYYTDDINSRLWDEKDQLQVYRKDSPYLATKKIGKNNPNEMFLKANNQARTEWNATVDRAYIVGVEEVEIMAVKKKYITEEVKEKIKDFGNIPTLFRLVVNAATKILAHVIERVVEEWQKQKESVEAFSESEPVVATEVSREELAEVERLEKLLNQPERPKILDHLPRLEQMERRLKDLGRKSTNTECLYRDKVEELSNLRGMFVGRKKKAIESEVAQLQGEIERQKEEVKRYLKSNGFENVYHFVETYKDAQKQAVEYHTENEKYLQLCYEQEERKEREIRRKEYEEDQKDITSPSRSSSSRGGRGAR